MSKIPDWAMEMAVGIEGDIPSKASGANRVFIRAVVARALVAAEKRGMERAAVAMKRMPDTVSLSDEEVERHGMFVRQVNNADRAAAIRQLGDEE